MELTDVAELQVLLEGVALPADRSELLEYAVGAGASPVQLGMIRRLPDREFDTIDEAAEKLASVQPERKPEVPHEPEEESGAPPGGDDYTKLDPESGAVRRDDAPVSA